jgi:hypothetical protein
MPAAERARNSMRSSTWVKRYRSCSTSQPRMQVVKQVEQGALLGRACLWIAETKVAGTSPSPRGRTRPAPVYGLLTPAGVACSPVRPGARSNAVDEQADQQQRRRDGDGEHHVAPGRRGQAEASKVDDASQGQPQHRGEHVEHRQARHARKRHRQPAHRSRGGAPATPRPWSVAGRVRGGDEPNAGDSAPRQAQKQRGPPPPFGPRRPRGT